jgi:hypothetical protein
MGEAFVAAGMRQLLDDLPRRVRRAAQRGRRREARMDRQAAIGGAFRSVSFWAACWMWGRKSRTT